MGNVCSISISMDNMISGCWTATGGQTTYICEFKNNFDAMKLALEDLQDFRTDVKRKIDMFEEQGLEQLDQVRRWFSRVESVETEADQLIKDGTTEIRKLCLGGCCSRNFISSYRLGKKLVKKVEDINALRCTRLFDMVADRLPPASVDERPCEATVGMLSTFNKVWNCLGEDEQVGIIGLYGLGGVGKTTLLTQINNGFLKTTHDFDVVIWAVVSRDLDISKVQDEIGKKVGFCDGTWRNKTKDEKAIDIFRALRKKRFVLLLDDIWEPVSLSDLGVPIPNQENKSKLVFTTRSEDVCCQMEAQKNIKVECLAWKESWDLFQSKVGQDTLNSHVEIPMLAEMVAKECCGLPLALVIIGRAMASKKMAEEWNYAIEVLQRAASIFPGMGDRVFPILKFSFNSLPSDAIKSCFLYCALFPEDFNILKENLIDYWLGEGFLHEFGDFDGARNQGHNIIGILLNACLLEKSSRDTLRMHDVVRDMALWIACEHGEVKNEFFVRTRVGPIEAPEFTRWARAKRISLMKNRIEKLTGAPPCSNLLTLFLDLNNLRLITKGFFQLMPHLRVLSLSRNRWLTEIPLEICNLVSLHYLDLSHTNIRLLPIELKNLLNLKCLNLNFTPVLNVIPRHLMSSFLLLQVLRMYSCDFSDELPNCSVLSGGNEDLLEELESLQQLHDLSITVESASALLRICDSKLKSCTREMCLKILYGVTSLDISSLENTKRLEKLYISSCSTLESLKVDHVEEDKRLFASYNLYNSMVRNHKCFSSLKHVGIASCPMLKDLTWLIFAPNLIYLGVVFCPKMEEVIMPLGERENGSLFSKLELLTLIDLPELKSIYWKALRVPHLKEVRVRSCPKLKKLPLNSNSTTGCGTVIYGEKYWATGLEWEDEGSRNGFLPCFISW